MVAQVHLNPIQSTSALLATETVTSNKPIAQPLHLSTISVAEGKEPNVSLVHEPPTIPHLHYTPLDLVCIDILELLHTLVYDLVSEAGDRIQYSAEESRKFLEEKSNLLLELSTKKQQDGIVVILEKIALCLSSGFSLTLGSALIANSAPALGLTFLVAGLLTAANFTATELGAWSALATELAQGNLERQKLLETWPPLILGFVSAALSFAAGSICWLDPASLSSLLLSQQLAGSIQMFLDLLNRGTTIAKSYTTFEKESLESQTAILDHKMLLESFYKKDLSRFLTDSSQNLQNFLESIKNLIKMQARITS